MSFQLLSLCLAALCFQLSADNVDDLIYKTIEDGQTPEASHFPGKLECRKLSAKEATEGLNLSEKQMKEISEKHQGFYGLRTSGFRTGDKFTFHQVNMVHDKGCSLEFVADEYGQLVSVEDRIPIKNMPLFLFGHMNGEPSHYALVSEDKKNCVVASVNPNPIEFEWADGAQISMTMLTPDASIYQLSANGFLPNETVDTISKSGEEKISCKVTAGSDGKWISMVLPGVVDMDGGSASLTVKRPQLKEEGRLDYYWGKAAQEHRG